MPYDKIEAADYEVWNGYIDYEETIKNSNDRMAKSEQLRLIDENAKWIKTRRDETSVTLNYNKYKRDIESNKIQPLLKKEKDGIKA